jgi:hypothetical protein
MLFSTNLRKEEKEKMKEKELAPSLICAGSVSDESCRILSAHHDVVRPWDMVILPGFGPLQTARRTRNP